MRRLLTLTAALEAATGVLLLSAPTAVVLALLGVIPTSPAAFAGLRIMGVALFVLGITCWFARNHSQGSAIACLMVVLLLYNAIVVLLFGYERVTWGLAGIGFWPAVIVHSVLLGWCVEILRRWPGNL